MSADFYLGDFVVRPQRHLIERGDESFHVKPRSMSVLECLASARGEPVSRNELFDKVWRGAEVTDDTLTKCIVELRKAFGDTARESRVIETIPKLGFRLVLPVEPLQEKATEAGPTAPGRQAPSGRRRSRFRVLGLSALGLITLIAALLWFDRSRAWLTEMSVTGFMKSAALLVPYSLDQEPGIAVLPFANMSGDVDNEYFSDGMSAEVINALGRAGRLPVIARSSSFEFKGQNKDVKEIGRLLGVTHVLEGSVRKADGTIRLTAQLIDATTGRQVWSGAYQRELTDIFALQTEIATDIVDQVVATLGDAMPLPAGSATSGVMAVSHTSNPRAYDLYLKGLELLHSTDPLPTERSVDYFERAIALDENYADAWAAKGIALYSLGRPSYGHSNIIPASVYPAAITALRRALEINPEHAQAMGWLGVTLMVNNYQWAEGLQLMKKSLDANPNDAELLALYAEHLQWMHLDGAEEVLYRAFRLDPYGFVPIVVRAGGLLQSGRILDAAALVEIGLMQDEEGYAPNYTSASLNLLIGRLDSAEERIRKARRVAHPDDLSLDGLQWVIDCRRGKCSPLPVTVQLQRMQKERLSHFIQRGAVVEWENEETIVAAFDLAIRQRHPELRGMLFGPKPAKMPEAEWRRIKEITGVTQFQQSQGLVGP